MAREVTGADYGRNIHTAARRSSNRLWRHEELAATLFPLYRKDAVYFIDDFLGDTIDTNNWLLSKDTGATSFAISAAANGEAAGATGTTDNDGYSIIGSAIWKGDLNCGFEARVKSSLVAGFQMEIGLIDAATDKTLPVVTDVDTPAVGNGGGNVAVFHIDTDQTLTTMAVVTDNESAVAKEDVSTFTPTADTYNTYRIQLTGNGVQWFIFSASGQLLHEGGGDLAVEGGTLVAPWVYHRTRNTTSKAATIDYIACWQERF